MSTADSKNPRRSLLFEHLVRAQELLLLRIARKKGCGVQSAQDVVQSTLKVAWVRLSSLLRKKPEITDGSVCAWVNGIERNKLHEHFRRRRETESVSEDGVAVDPLPDQLAMLNESLATLSRALQQLNEDDRTLLEMFFWEDLKPAEVAKRLGLTPGAVKMRGVRAKTRLGRALKASGDLSSCKRVL